MEPFEVEALLAEYDRMAAEGHWQVHPWTGLTMRPFTGTYLNIDLNGERRGAPPSGEHEDQPPLVVWAFGGSTLFGWGLADDYTPPSQLQTALQALYPDRQVQVVNFAVPIYNSSQEVALLVANLRASRPDIAVFLDGVNDVWFTMYANTQTSLVDHLAGVWEGHTERITLATGLPWMTFNPSFPPYRLASQLGIDPANLRPNYAVRYAMQGTGAATPGEQLAVTIDSYRANCRMARAVSEEFGVDTYFFIQPWNDQEYFPSFRQAVLEANDCGNLFDVSDTFERADDTDHAMYVDDIHYSDYGSQILTARLAEIIFENSPS
jgi:lysophospholipase L1-like esterase